MSDDLEMRRHEAGGLTVDEAVALGYRAQAVCLACERRPMLDLRRLAAQGRGGQVLNSLRLSG